MTRNTCKLYALFFSSASVNLVYAADAGFLEQSTATLQTRNYFFSRDFSNLRGTTQSLSQEWAQGFILNFTSGYTPGPVGFGVDAIGKFGLKLDSSPGLANSGLLPVKGNGQAPDEYGRLGLAAKIRVANTVLKFGELQPNLPTLVFSDIRLLPPTYQGTSITSNEIQGLTLQAGHLTSNTQRNEAGESKLQALLGNKPQRQATSDAFDYVGGDYAFNDKRTTASVWLSQLEDIYTQNFYGLKHYEPVGDWVLGANLGYYDAKEQGQKRVGKVDNRSFFSLLSAKYGGHTFYTGYQGMYGDSAFPRLFLNVSSLGNELPTYEFVSAHERSYQLRYDFDFVALKVPGLVASTRYVTGDNARTAGGYEGKDRERDLDLSYTFQASPLKGLAVRLRNAVARSNYRTGITENRLVMSYTWKLR
jgi:hypothetical protein